MSVPEWWPDWKGETAVIVASGPTASTVPLAKAKGKAKFIVINNSWQLAPWADILFGCDFSWWKFAGGCPEFKGLKMTVEAQVAKHYPDVKVVKCRKPDDRIVLDELGTVGWGGNSGFHCLNLAVQFGCSKVLLVGMDMTIAHGVHWHGKHPPHMNNPTNGNIARWARAVDAAAAPIRQRGVKVFNCSDVSVLSNYPKLPFEKALTA